MHYVFPNGLRCWFWSEVLFWWVRLFLILLGLRLGFSHVLIFLPLGCFVSLFLRESLLFFTVFICAVWCFCSLGRLRRAVACSRLMFLFALLRLLFLVFP